MNHLFYFWLVKGSVNCVYHFKQPTVLLSCVFLISCLFLFLPQFLGHYVLAFLILWVALLGSLTKFFFSYLFREQVFLTTICLLLLLLLCPVCSGMFCHQSHLFQEINFQSYFFNITLFSFHVFLKSPKFLLLISSFNPLWPEKIHDMNASFLTPWDLLVGQRVI